MFGISGEHLLVLLVILLIFGPKRLPDLGHSIGRTLKNFKDGLNTHTEAQDRAAERERLEAKQSAEKRGEASLDPAGLRLAFQQSETAEKRASSAADPANSVASPLASTETPATQTAQAPTTDRV